MKFVNKLSFGSASRVGKHILSDDDRSISFLANLLCSEYSFVYENEKTSNTEYSNIWRQWIISKYEKKPADFVAYLGNFVPKRYDNKINSKNFIKAIIAVSKKTNKISESPDIKKAKEIAYKKIEAAALELEKAFIQELKNQGEIE